MLRFLDLTLSGIAGGFVLAAVALPLVMILRSTRVINFAQGAMLMLTTFVAVTVLERTGSYWLALAVAMGAGFVLGAVIERAFVRRLAAVSSLNAAVVTLGVLILLQSVAGMIWGGNLRSYPTAFSIQGFQVGGVRLSFSPADLFDVAAVSVALFATVALFRWTELGLRMRATADAPVVARLLGVKVGRMLTLGWAISAALGALAGVLLAPTTFVGPSQFDETLVAGFTAAVIGGLESPVGAVVGAVLLGCALAYVTGYLGSEATALATFTLLVFVLVLRPEGLFGRLSGRRV
ncbi:branched-chain amino acid ABC transporter permease [Streptomyces sp. NPDC005529]|uniref:branched-chain amino acid ABC transporter permease n=1 Tax=unclassified Streptomyces TaxID=2593676 RepID=UPI0033A2EF7C